MANPCSARKRADARDREHNFNTDAYFRPSVTWSDVTASTNSFRYYPAGFVFDATGHSASLIHMTNANVSLSFCNNKFSLQITSILNPNMHFHIGYFDNYRGLTLCHMKIGDHNEMSHTVAQDWNVYEHSWDFRSLPILTVSSDPTPTLESSYTVWTTQNRDTIAEMKRLEEENNRLFIDAYGLPDELTPEVPIEQITLTVNPAYRYGGKLSEDGDSEMALRS